MTGSQQVPAGILLTRISTSRTENRWSLPRPVGPRPGVKEIEIEDVDGKAPHGQTAAGPLVSFEVDGHGDGGPLGTHSHAQKPL